LQLQHPDSLAARGSFTRGHFNFQRFLSLDIYDNDNAYLVKAADLGGLSTIAEWLSVERIVMRTASDVPLVTARQLSQHDSVMAGMAAGDPIGAEDVLSGPVGSDGYPRKLWDARRAI